MHRSIVMLVLASGMLPASGQAHFFAEAHACKAPLKPLEFITELGRLQFERQVDNYRNCLQTFVDKQNSAMAKHQSSALQAEATWNNYAQRELGSTQSETSKPQ